MAIYKAAVVYNRHFFMVDSTNHLSAKTGLTPTVNISKAGAAFGAAAGAVSEIGNGWYRVALTTADTGTTGDLLFHITSAGADDTDFADQIVSYDPFDSAALGLSRIDAAITTRMATFTLPTNFASLAITAGGAVTAGTVSDKTGYSLTQTFPANFSSFALTAGGAVTVGTNSDKTGYALTAGEHTSITADVWDSARSGHTTAGTFGQGVASVQGNVTGSVASVTGAVGSVTGAVGSVTTGVTVTTNNDKTGYALSTAGVQAMWDEATSSLTTVGSIGKRLADDIDATISSRSTFAGGAVASVTAAVTLDLTQALPGSPAAGSTGEALKQADTLAFTSGKVNSHVLTTAVDAIDSGSLATSAAQEIADNLLDRADAIETGLTPRGTLRLVASALAGKASGLSGTTATFRNAVADSKARITATVDVDGNRTAVTTDTT